MVVPQSPRYVAAFTKYNFKHVPWSTRFDCDREVSKDGLFYQYTAVYVLLNNERNNCFDWWFELFCFVHPFFGMRNTLATSGPQRGLWRALCSGWGEVKTLLFFFPVLLPECVSFCYVLLIYSFCGPHSQRERAWDPTVRNVHKKYIHCK